MSVEEIKSNLIAAAKRDVEVRAQVLKSGKLAEGYDPQMEAVHLENARILERAIDEIGWPSLSKVGDEAARAAFMILQHAISRPDLQRRGLALLMDGFEANEVNQLDVAYLSDRIAMFEGRGQLFGTQFDMDENGQLSPALIHEPEKLDERRASVGLPPMAPTITMVRANAAMAGQQTPPNLAKRRADFEAWTRRVGWRA